MNYKWLYKRFVGIIISPSKAWKEISEDPKDVDVQSMYVYPLIGICGLVAFLVSFFSNFGEDISQYDIFRRAIVNACLTVIPLFIVYIASIYVMNNMLVSFFRTKSDMDVCRKMVGYSMTVMFLAYILLSFPVDFKILLWLAQVYTLFVVWEGSGRLLRMDDNKRLVFSLFLFLMLVLGGGILYFILYKLV